MFGLSGSGLVDLPISFRFNEVCRNLHRFIHSYQSCTQFGSWWDAEFQCTKFSTVATLFGVIKLQLKFSYLTLRPPSTTNVSYANHLDPDETPNYSASHPGPSYLTLNQHFYQLWSTLKHFKVGVDEQFSRRQFSRRAKG